MSERSGDRLKAYRGKRRAGRTPEPGVAKPTRPHRRAAEKIFVVHKHDARRLHYDLRLEIEGALASWAVPKGPSFDPQDRRLAVETEDHPIEYAGFEGRIPEGQYGAGDSLLWDRGAWETIPPGQEVEMRKAGHLHFELRGEKLHGRWHLIRTRPTGRSQQWLLFKSRDEFAGQDDVIRLRPESVVSGRRVTRGPIPQRERKRTHPAPMDLLLKVWPPMLATLREADTPLEDEQYVYEVKYDGFRALAALSGGRLALQSRNGLDLSTRFPRIARALAGLDLPEVVLDGEIVALDSQGVDRFEQLQTSGPDQRYCVFDLLWLDGEDLRARTLDERRELLESVLSNVASPVVLAERLPEARTEALRLARQRGLEGVIAKQRASKYVGERSRAWLKLKIHKSQEVAIVGYTPITTGEPAIGALLLGVAKARGGFEYAGKVGTGYDTATRRSLRKLLEPDRVERPPVALKEKVKDARWVRPRRVAEVRFTEWTRDGRLRHPVFAGLRDDKKVEECVRERPET